MLPEYDCLNSIYVEYILSLRIKYILNQRLRTKIFIGKTILLNCGPGPKLAG